MNRNHKCTDLEGGMVENSLRNKSLSPLSSHRPLADRGGYMGVCWGRLIPIIFINFLVKHY